VWKKPEIYKPWGLTASGHPVSNYLVCYLTCFGKALSSLGEGGKGENRISKNLINISVYIVFNW
jgi:hypothetical protein